MKVRGGSSTAVLPTVALVAMLLAGLATTARAEETITIELRSGEKVTGKLEGFAERIYKVKIGGQSLSFKEGDVKRIDFGAEPAKAAEPTKPEPSKPAPPLFELLPKEKDLPAGITLSAWSEFKGATALAAQRAILMKDPQRNGDDLEILAGATETAHLELEDGRDSIVVNAFVYESAAAAGRAGVAQRRKLATTLASDAVCFDTGPVRVMLFERRAHPRTIAAVTRLFREALERQGALRAERLEAQKLERVDDARRFIVPRACLPEGLTDVKLARVSELDEKEGSVRIFGVQPYRITYSAAGGGTIVVDIHYTSPESTAAAPKATEVARYRAAWIGDGAAVTLTVTGTVPGEAVKAIEEQLARDLECWSNTRGAKLYGAAAPPAKKDILAADVIGLVGEVPGMTRGRVRAVSSGDTASPFGDLAAEGVADLTLVEYVDRGRTGLVVARLVDEAAMKKFLTESRAKLARLGYRVTLVHAGMLGAVVMDKGAAAASVANLVASVTAALERATGAAPVAERIPSAAPALDVSAFAFPKELVPGGVATVEIQADGKWLDKPGLAGTRTGPARAVYKLESGNVLEVHLWSHLDGAPTIDEMSPYRYVWAAEQAVWNGLTGAATSTTYTKPLVALAAPGVPDATVAALAALIRAELETCRPGTLKVLKAVEKASDAPKAKKVAVADLVPTPDELPAGFSMAGYRTNIIQTSWGVDYAEEGEANLDERGTVYVELFRVKASVLDGLAKVKAKALTLGKPVEILVAGDHYIVLIETDPVSTSGRDALVAVLEAKLSAATGLKATRTRVPALYAGFDLSGIRPVTSQLPAGVALGAIEVAAVSSFANANTAEVARYKGGSFEVTLRVLWNRAQSGHDRAIGAPSDAELRPLAAAWLAQWTAVTIETKGEVPAAVLDFFRAHVESELKRFTATRDAKRLEIPKPRLWAAGDLVPQSDELPKFASVEHEARLDARQLRDESANALGGSPTNGPLVAAMNAGARDAVTIHYQESRNREVRFHVRSYESAAQAAAAVVPTRRCAGHYFSSLREVWLVENVVCAVEDYNVSAEGWDALRAALASRAASLGDLRAEARPVTRQLLAFVPYVATHALPRGWKIAENRNAGTPVRSPLGESESSYRCDYSNGTGMVTIVAHVAKVPADPAAGALEGYRGAWLLDDRKSCFTLKVTGEVDAKDRAIFEKHIAAELACSVEGRTAKHLDAAAIAKKVQEDAALDPLDGLQVAQTEKGAFVKSVAKDSRAEKMGFKVGDRITTSGPDHIMVERDGKEIMLRRVE